MHLREVCEAALGERSQQVERRRRLVVGGQQAAGVGRAGRLGGCVVVDHVTAEARQGDSVDDLGARRARFGELPGDAAQFHHGHAGAVGQHDGHLENDLELVADAVGGEVVKGLGAVAGLQEEGFARRHLGQGPLQAAGLSGEDERGKGGQRLEGLVEDVLVRPLRLLLGRKIPPPARGPQVWSIIPTSVARSRRREQSGHLLGAVSDH